jgi:NAD(P)-dependent dehydrogenase (short-subunit alcohol dehydrogenase family)
MDLGISGKWALVCGASKGLGFGCAQVLVAGRRRRIRRNFLSRAV